MSDKITLLHRLNHRHRSSARLNHLAVSLILGCSDGITIIKRYTHYPTSCCIMRFAPAIQSAFPRRSKAHSCIARQCYYMQELCWTPASGYLQKYYIKLRVIGGKQTHLPARQILTPTTGPQQQTSSSRPAQEGKGGLGGSSFTVARLVYSVLKSGV